MTLHRASRAHEFAKVLVDRLGAAVALVVLSPIIAATLSASGSAWGRRSSSVRFERVATGAVHHPEVQDDGDAGGVLLCRPGACRGIQMAPGTTIPWFTRLVRGTGLDELPQLDQHPARRDELHRSLAVDGPLYSALHGGTAAAPLGVARHLGMAQVSGPRCAGLSGPSLRLVRRSSSRLTNSGIDCPVAP